MLQTSLKLARNLLTQLGFAGLVFLFCGSSIFANVSEKPIIIPADPLLTPVQLVNGIISEVTVPSTSIAVIAHADFFPSSKITGTKGNGKVKSIRLTHETYFSNSIRLESPASVDDLRNENAPFGFLAKRSIFKIKSDLRQSVLKSIAKTGLFAFFEICLSQSELPSKNLSMRCENSQWKSMTQRSANAWKSSWPLAKMTYLLPKSICSLLTRKASTHVPSQSRLRSMSDTLSIWSNEVVSSQQTSPAIPQPQLEAIAAKIQLNPKS
ncbi:MAG: hypothetical protein SH817_09505 [Leptospira sp.]|nr:hypothetical protein [Leptospira sp.]